MEITDENKNEIKDQINTDINNTLENMNCLTEWMDFQS